MITGRKRILCLLLAVMILVVSGCTLPGTNLAMDEVPESTEGKDLTVGKAADNIFSLNINCPSIDIGLI